jgi:BlaI family transcriptional regulator, penicillinase repressor
MKQLPRISDAEWTVMKVLWSRSPLPASDIIAELEHTQQWHPKTVKTLLNRLVGKGALGFSREGKAYLYHPLVSETDCAGAASDAFLSRVFGGSLKPMLAHFVQKKRLSPEELKELKRLLDEE